MERTVGEPWPLFHDPHLSVNPGTKLAQLVDEVSESIEKKIRPTITKRARKSAVQGRKEVIGNILANLATLALMPSYEPRKRLAVSTAKTKPNRYNRSALTRSILSDMLKAIEAQELVVRHPYEFKQRLTTIEPTAIFLETLGVLSLTNVVGKTDGESIVLSVRNTNERHFGEPAPKDRINYEDDSDSRRFRKEMKRINSFLNIAQLTYDGFALAPIALKRNFLLRKISDPEGFSLNGRLSGGWWMNLPSCDRHRIRINGEELADLDFKGMFVQLAYRCEGLVLRDDFDPYAIPGLEAHRNGAKHAMLSLLGRPKAMRRLSHELKNELPNGWNAKQLVASATELHSDIRHLFGKDIGVQLMFLESQILIAVLLQLIEEGIAALPMHDGIMVPKSLKYRVAHVMREASAAVLDGSPLPVTEKPIIQEKW